MAEDLASGANGNWNGSRPPLPQPPAHPAGGALAEARGAPDVFMHIIEQSMLVAAHLRDDYFDTTLAVADALREMASGPNGLLAIGTLSKTDLEPRTVAFVDGGIGRVNLNLAVPVIVRAGIFRVKEGETDPDLHETFAHFPLVLGELDGGLKTDAGYATVVRALVEAMALRAVMYEPDFRDVDLVMLHGPLVYLADPLFRHWFPKCDLHRILGAGPGAEEVVAGFDRWCGRCRYTASDDCRASRAADQTPAMCVLAFLLEDVVECCRRKGKLLCGVVERSSARGLVRRCLRKLADSGHPALTALTAQMSATGNRKVSARLVEDVLEATRYRDSMLMALALRRGEYTEPEPLVKGGNDRRQALFPAVLSSYLRPTRSRPLRVEMPDWLSQSEQVEVLSRVYAYADLLPGYAFPIGLDIVDKYTAIPGWMTKAFETNIRWEYGRLMAGQPPQLGHLADHMFFQPGRSRATRPGV
ncbi:MAG: DNA double-strand break repair nuclease NurA [Actinobacteria bacterium]|nr:DNA double-strand break repair nuclease NurA [Actinomycetota bacterium]